MQASGRPSFAPAEAGMVIVAAVAICAIAGALVGWAAGSVGLGVLVGVVVGLPTGVVSVYRRFREYFR